MMLQPIPSLQEIEQLLNPYHIPPAAFLALIDIESRGEAFEAADDDTTPRFLFERHVFERFLKDSPEKLKAASEQGLTRSSWTPSNQYLDQKTSKDRLALLSKASRIDIEAAYSACSWGVGQIMGFHAQSLGFKSALEMVEKLKTGILAQYEILAQFLASNGYIEALNLEDTRVFARLYNGPGYAAHHYDQRFKAARAKWREKLRSGSSDQVNQIDDPSASLIRHTQQQLKAKGYYEVGLDDGIFGSRTRGALLAFKADQQLELNDQLDDQTLRALALAPIREGSDARLRISANALRATGSQTIQATDHIKAAAIATGVTGIGSSLVEIAPHLSEAKNTLSPVLDLIAGSTPKLAGLAILIFAILTWWYAHHAEQARVQAEQDGRHF